MLWEQTSGTDTALSWIVEHTFVPKHFCFSLFHYAEDSNRVACVVSAHDLDYSLLPMHLKLKIIAGDGNDYLNLALKDGGVSLTISIGNGRLDTGIKSSRAKFNDDEWHHVVVSRIAKEVSE